MTLTRWNFVPENPFHAAVSRRRFGPALQRWIPEPAVFALILTLLIAVLTLAVLPVMCAGCEVRGARCGVRILARDVPGHLVVPFVWIYAGTALLVTLAP